MVGGVQSRRELAGEQQRRSDGEIMATRNAPVAGRTWRRGLAVALIGAALSGCSSSTPMSPSTPTVPTLRGSVSDPAGDARSTSANPPDLDSATIEIANGVVTVTVGFTPG